MSQNKRQTNKSLHLTQTSKMSDYKDKEATQKKKEMEEKLRMAEDAVKKAKEMEEQLQLAEERARKAEGKVIKLTQGIDANPLTPENPETEKTSSKTETPEMEKNDANRQDDVTGNVGDNNQERTIDNTIKYLYNTSPQIITTLINYDILPAAEEAQKCLKRPDKGREIPFNHMVDIMIKMQEVIIAFQKRHEDQAEINQQLRKQIEDQAEIIKLLREKIATTATVHEGMREVQSMIAQQKQLGSIEDTATFKDEINKLFESTQLMLTAHQKNTEIMIKEAVQKEIATHLTSLKQPPIPTPETPSYAKVASNTFQTNKDTALMICPTKDTSVTDIRRNILQLQPDKYGLLKCTESRTGKLFVQCRSKENLEELKKVIETTPEIHDKVSIDKLKPKRSKIMIFGAPKIKPYLWKSTAAVPEDIEQYIKDYLFPFFRKHISDVETFKLIKTQDGRRGASNLVIELIEHEAESLILKKNIIIGYQQCLVKKHIFVLRCFNCQRHNHSANKCTARQICSICALNHPSEQCPNKDSQRNHRCVNCIDHNEELKPGQQKFRLNTNHRSFDRICGSYKLLFEQAMRESKKNNPENKIQ